jgi:hypothetical protein
MTVLQVLVDEFRRREDVGDRRRRASCVSGATVTSFVETIRPTASQDDQAQQDKHPVHDGFPNSR